MSKFFVDLRNGSWFVPGIVVLVSAALAIGALEVDAAIGVEALSGFPRIFGAGAEASRQLLAAIATSTITVAGVVFSITIVALSLTAAQYSPRVLRTFMSDRPNQFVLGTFVGIYVYCLLVLRAVRGGEDSFVPGISIVVALLLALFGTGVLIFFIHHISSSIQVSHIAARVARETLDSVRRIYPTALGSGHPEARAGMEHGPWHCVQSAATGYIQRVDFQRLIACARTQRRVVRMERRIGEFVIKGHRLLSVSGTAPEASFADALRSAYTINTYRDIHQDPASGVQQLVDIALKALSPGVNDIGTARNVLHHVAAILAELCARSLDEERCIEHEGELALLKRELTFEQFVDEAIGPVRRAAVDNVDMLLELLAVLGELARTGEVPQRRAAIVQHIDAIRDAVNTKRLGKADETALTVALMRAQA